MKEFPPTSFFKNVKVLNGEAGYIEHPVDPVIVCKIHDRVLIPDLDSLGQPGGLTYSCTMEGCPTRVQGVAYVSN